MKLALIAAASLVLAGVAFGQAASESSASPVSFEVASIKASGPLDPAAILAGKAHFGIYINKARVDIGNVNLMGLICWAYNVKPNEIAGNPDWLNVGMNADRFDILAKIPDGAGESQVPEMMQTLLAQRFHLQAHREKRDLHVYVLVVGKSGSKLKEADPEPAETAQAADGSSAEPAPAKGEVSFGNGENRVSMKPTSRGMAINTKETGPMRIVPAAGSLRMEADRMSMETFAGLLSQYLGRPVVDQTELKGKYRVSLEIAMDTVMTMARNMGMNAPGATNSAATPADAASEPSSGSSLFAAVQQLGLRLESRKLPYDIVVIDHVERIPTEN